MANIVVYYTQKLGLKALLYFHYKLTSLMLKEEIGRCHFGVQEIVTDISIIYRHIILLLDD